GQLDEYSWNGKCRPCRGARWRQAARLFPDSALLRPPSARTADHAIASARPEGLELRDLEDGRGVLRQPKQPRLDLATPGQRVRTAKSERSSADLRPAPHGGQAVLRHGYTP